MSANESRFLSTAEEVEALPFGSVVVGFPAPAVGVKSSGVGERTFEVFYPDMGTSAPLELNHTHGAIELIYTPPAESHQAKDI